MNVVDARFVAGATTLAALPAPAFAELAFAGRSNVGKSTLINSLIGRRNLVRTSSTPGCTRQLNLFRIQLKGGATLDFVDLPGYGYAKRSKRERTGWGPMIETFLAERVGLRATVVLVDVRRGVQEEEEQLLEFLESVGCPSLLVATKLDKVPSSKRKATLQKLQADTQGRRVIGHSSQTGDGQELLWRALLQACAIELG